MTAPEAPSSSPSDPLVRMLTLLPWLRSRGPVELRVVAAHFGVSESQLRSELAMLTFVGPGQAGGELVDISYEDGLVVVHDSQGLEFPLRLSADEATTLIAALTLLAELPGADSAAATALAKLEQAAGVAAGRADTLVVAHEHADVHVEQVIDDALRDGVQLHLSYAGAARDALTERLVDPVRVVVVDGRTYLEAWCHLAEGIRLFRFDRVVKADIVANPVVARDHPDQVNPDTARIPDGFDVRLHLTPAADFITELRTCVNFTRLPDGSLDATVRVADTEWLVRLMLSLGSDARLIDSAELDHLVRERAQAALLRYE